MMSHGPKYQVFSVTWGHRPWYNTVAATAAIAGQIAAVFHAKSGCINQFVHFHPISTHKREENYSRKWKYRHKNKLVYLMNAYQVLSLHEITVFLNSCIIMIKMGSFLPSSSPTECPLTWHFSNN